MYNFEFFTMVKTKTELLTVTRKLHIWPPVQFGGGDNLQFTCKKLFKNPHL